MGDDRLSLVHLNLTVADVGRSMAFYQRWFGFDGPPRAYPDGTVFLGNADGFDLALHPGLEAPPEPGTHFGFRVASPDRVRRLLADLRGAGVVVIEAFDGPDHVGFKCLDLDRYVVEVYWEPQPSGP